MSNDEKLSVERAYAYLILRTSRLLRFHFHAMVSTMGMDLSPEQWLILNRLTHANGLSQSELIDATFKDRANTSRMLASLERKGLIRRKQDSADGRKYTVYLSAIGRDWHRKLVPTVKREREKVYAGLTDRDFEALKRVLDTIDRNILEGFAEPGGGHSSESEPMDESPVNEHVPALDEFFKRGCRLPRMLTPLRDVLLQETDALLAGYRRRDAGAAMMIQLDCPLPAKRPADDEVFGTDFTRDDALRTIARAYLFDSWADVEAAGDRPVDPRFETAVDAVVFGRTLELARLLGEDQNLVAARSPFGHRSTLLHYVAANGVEIRRQRTPRNAAKITTMLLEAGADVDALSGSYGGGSNQTALCLTVSSGHPYEAGVQTEIVAALLDGSAKINGLDDDGMPLATALAFGYAETAELLVRRGARVDNIVLAAGLGRLDLVRSLMDDQGRLLSDQRYVDPFGPIIESSQHLKDRAFFVACKLGHGDVGSLLIEAGANITSRI